jgi:hypothetical protein
VKQTDGLFFLILMEYFWDVFKRLGGRGNLLFYGSRPLLASNLPMSIYYALLRQAAIWK